MIVNGRFLTQRTTGVQRFAREIVRASAELGLWTPANCSLVMPSDPDAPSGFAGLPVRRAGRQTGHLWEQFDLPGLVGDDALMSFCSTGPLRIRRQMIVLHDAAVAVLPQNFTLAFRAWYRIMIAVYGRRALKIGTVSRFSADELMKHFNIGADKIEIIPESGEHILREEPDYSLHETFGLDADRYFLAVSSLASNKNFAGILKAVALLPKLPFKFVIVGGRNAKVFAGADMDVSGAVEVGYVSDAQLRALYARAACFVYPSTYEGFGLPPLEAMCCGCPVLAANASALPEVCGPAAAYCDPHRPEDIAKHLSGLLASTSRRQELRDAGLARAAQWTWAAAARRLSEIDL